MTPHYTPQTASITSKELLANNIFLFTLDLPLGSKPGQFVNLWIPGLDEKPFSVAFDDPERGLGLAISAIGPFTKALAEMQVKDRLGVRGPYGKGFSVRKNERVLLIGGGFGAAPLHFSGRASQAAGSEVHIVLGARNKDLLIYEEVCTQDDFTVHITTDDGSAGEQGNVLLPLKTLLEEKAVDVVQTCGPERMMHAVATICREYNIPCEVSLERYMKCGFGVCGQCTCDKKLVCQDGPVFSGEEVLTLEDFGQFHRGPEGQKIAY